MFSGYFMSSYFIVLYTTCVFLFIGLYHYSMYYIINVQSCGQLAGFFPSFSSCSRVIWFLHMIILSRKNVYLSTNISWHWLASNNRFSINCELFFPVLIICKCFQIHILSHCIIRVSDVSLLHSLFQLESTLPSFLVNVFHLLMYLVRTHQPSFHYRLLTTNNRTDKIMVPVGRAIAITIGG
jgi:hypothetical protein